MQKASELFEVGQIVSFLGYDDSVPQDQRSFGVDQVLKVHMFKNDVDDGIAVQPISDEGEEIGEPGIAFADEIQAYPPEEAEEGEDLPVVEEEAVTQPAIKPDTKTASKAKKGAASKAKKDTKPAIEVATDLSPAEKEIARKARKAAKDKIRRAKNKADKEAAAQAEAEAKSAALVEKTVKAKNVEPSQEDDKAAAQEELEPSHEAVAANQEAEQTELETAISETTEDAIKQMTSVESILDSHDAIDAADLLIKQAEQTYFTLGGVLTHIYHHGDYKSIGFKTDRGWQKYIDERLGMHYRKVMDLIKIYEKFLAAGISEDELVRFGWSKARLLARIPVDKLIEDWDELKDWYEKSRKEIEDGIKVKYKDSLQTRDDNNDKTTTVNVRVTLSGEAGETVQRAFDVAKGFAETDEEAGCLEYICGEWLAMHEAVDTPIEEMIKFVEARYQVSLKIEGSNSGSGVEGSVHEDDHEDESEEEDEE